MDGIVLARSAFHHSINYRSAILYGTLRAVEDPDERTEALEAFTEKLIPGRWAHVRRPTRAGAEGHRGARAADRRRARPRSAPAPPVDDDEDYALDAWAGVVPLRVTAGEPEPDPRLRPGIEVPEHVSALLAGR